MMMRFLQVTVVLGAVTVFAGASFAEIAILHVDAAADGADADGLSWDTAFPNLQDAFTAANTGEIWVAAGVYRPASPGGSRAASFAFPNGVAVYGGFSGEELNREERNPFLYETILCGDLNGDDGTGTVTDNSNRVVTVVNQLSESNRLDGFTLRGGRADFTPTRNTGAGIYLENGKLILANCQLKDNRATNNGGAIYVKSGDMGGTALQVFNSTFVQNASNGFGSALFAAPNNAGTQHPSIQIEGCLFQANAYQYAVSGNSAQIVLRRNYFMDNEGGAVSANDRVMLTAENCVFTRNGGMSGAFYLGTRSSATLLHCTLADNYATEIRVMPDTYIETFLSIENSIVWNSYYAVLEVSSQTAANAEIAVSNTLITGGYSGSGNGEYAPHFRRAEPPCQLSWDSMAIDFCKASMMIEDIEGQVRPQNGAYDAGAYEFGEDTDGGGLPDWFERDFGLNTMDLGDDALDTDRDGLDNLEEFRRGTAPNDPNDPPNAFHVALDGDNATGDGSADYPWRTITWALAFAEEATPTFPVTIHVGAGVFEERLQLRPYTWIRGVGQDLTVIQHYAPSDAENIVVEGAEGAGLSDCTVTFPGNVSDVAVLLRIIDVSMLVERVTFDGKDQLFTIGAQFYGPNASNTLLRYCTFRRVQYGVQSANAAPVITRSLFQDIRNDAIFIREPETGEDPNSLTPVLGTVENESTGLNTFENINGRFIDNNSSAATEAQMNYYGEEYTEESEIATRMEGPVVYVPFVGKSMASGGIFCAVWNAASDQRTPVTNATARLTPLNMTVTENTTGVYAFPAVSEGAYTVTVTAPNYSPSSRSITVSESELVSLSFPLSPHAAEGEGEEPLLSVPNLVGMTQAEAASTLTAAGLVLGVVGEQYHATIPAGQILSQSPQAGAQVVQGTAVAITVSLGEEPPAPVSVPDLIGKTRAEAETILSASNLILGAVTEQYHPTIPAGQIISQSPQSGAQVAQGTAVAITTSLGEEPPQLVNVPDLSGMTQEEARIALEALGLVLGTVSEQYNPDTPVGQVVSQSPQPGAQVALGTAVAITTSLGEEPPQPVIVPDLSGMTEEEARLALETLGLVLGDVSEQYHAVISVGQVISQSPQSGAQVAQGTTVSITLSLGKEPHPPVTVPDLAGLTREAAEAALAEAGLLLGSIGEQYHPTIPIGQIISQSPLPNALVAPNTAISITLSLGPEPVAPVSVPNLVGMTREAAEAALVQAGLTLGSVIEQYHPSVPAGQVISQTPESEAHVPPGTAVSITLSLGPEPEPLTPKQIAEQLLAQFDAADANGDGKLDISEARTIIPNLTEAQFAALDANEDGYLTRKELEEALGKTGCRGCSGKNKLQECRGVLGHWLLVGAAKPILQRGINLWLP